MKATTILGIGAVVVVAYLVHKSHKEHLIAIQHKKLEPKGPARDVYSGDYIDPIRPRWPYNTPYVIPHRDIYSGKPISNHDPYPSQPKSRVEDFIIGKMVAEFQAEGRLDHHAAAGLNSRIKMDYGDEIAHIAKMNKYKEKPLHGQALSEYSSLILKVAHMHGLYLSSSARAIYQAQTFISPIAHMHSVHRVDAANIDFE